MSLQNTNKDKLTKVFDNQKEKIKSNALAQNVVTEDDVVVELVPELLNEEEEAELNELEAIGEKTSRTMLESAREFGRILTVIKDKGYFRKKRKNQDFPVFQEFGDYVRWRFNRGRTMGYNYIAIYNVMTTLEGNGMDPQLLNTTTNTIVVADEVKKLMKFEKIDKEQAENITNQIILKSCQLIVNTAPTDEQGNPKIDQEHLYEVFDVMKDVVRDKVVEIDGNQIPVSLAALAVEDQITMGLEEQIQRRRAANYDQYQEVLVRREEPKEPIKQPQEPVEIDENNYVKVTCPKHGETTPFSLVQAGFWTHCGCLVLMEEVEAGHSEFIWVRERTEDERI